MAKKETPSITQYVIVCLMLLNILIIYEMYIGEPDWYQLLFVTIPLLLLAVLFHFFRPKGKNGSLY